MEEAIIPTPPITDDVENDVFEDSLGEKKVFAWGRLGFKDSMWRKKFLHFHRKDIRPVAVIVWLGMSIRSFMFLIAIFNGVRRHLEDGWVRRIDFLVFFCLMVVPFLACFVAAAGYWDKKESLDEGEYAYELDMPAPWYRIWAAQRWKWSLTVLSISFYFADGMFYIPRILKGADIALDTMRARSFITTTVVMCGGGGDPRWMGPFFVVFIILMNWYEEWVRCIMFNRPLSVKANSPTLFTITAVDTMWSFVVVAVALFIQQRLVLSFWGSCRLAKRVQDHKSTCVDLERQRRIAENASKVKSDFLAMVSHEMRTPLHGVIIAAGLLREDVNEQLTPLTDMIKLSSKQLLSIINSVLDLTAAESGAMKVEDRPFSIRQVIEDVCAIVNIEMVKKDVFLVMDIVAPGLPEYVRGDEVKVRQIVLNLLSNAKKFTPMGGAIVVRLYLEKDEKYCIEVSDTGIGIKKEAQRMLFQPFQQADSSIRRRFGGSGLGLALCVRFVSSMKGTMDIESVAGKGSTFVVKLPLRTEKQLAYYLMDSGLRKELHHQQLLLVIPCTVFGEWVKGVFTGYAQVASAKLETRYPEEVNYFLKTNTPKASIVCSSISHKEDVFGLLKGKGVPFALIVQGNGVRHQRIQRSKREDYVCTIALPLWNTSCTQALSLLCGIPVSTLPTPKRSETSPATSLRTSEEGHAKVLLVDDNPMNIILTQRVIERLGWKCETAENGEKGVNAVLKRKHKLVLMDYHMPCMDGLEATQKIREALKASDYCPHIVLLSADVSRDVSRKAKDAGCNECVTKPLGLKELGQIVERIMEDK